MRYHGLYVVTTHRDHLAAESGDDDYKTPDFASLLPIAHPIHKNQDVVSNTKKRLPPM